MWFSSLFDKGWLCAGGGCFLLVILPLAIVVLMTAKPKDRL